MAVSAIMIGLQILIVFVGGSAFAVTPLNGQLWVVSLVLGFLTLPIGAAVRCLPDRAMQAVIDLLAAMNLPRYGRAVGRPFGKMVGVVGALFGKIF
jgi:hypothetical protein